MQLFCIACQHKFAGAREKAKQNVLIPKNDILIDCHTPPNKKKKKKNRQGQRAMFQSKLSQRQANIFFFSALKRIHLDFTEDEGNQSTRTPVGEDTPCAAMVILDYKAFWSYLTLTQSVQ